MASRAIKIRQPVLQGLLKVRSSIPTTSDFLLHLAWSCELIQGRQVIFLSGWSRNPALGLCWAPHFAWNPRFLNLLKILPRKLQEPGQVAIRCQHWFKGVRTHTNPGVADAHTEKEVRVLQERIMCSRAISKHWYHKANLWILSLPFQLTPTPNCAQAAYPL